MPTLLYFKGFRFYFHSREGTPREPAHVHIEKSGIECKIWLKSLTVAYNYGIKEKDLSMVREIVIENQDLFLRRWHEHFNQ